MSPLIAANANKKSGKRHPPETHPIKGAFLAAVSNLPDMRLSYLIWVEVAKANKSKFCRTWRPMCGVSHSLCTKA